MKIELKEIPVRDIFNGYIDNEEEGVRGYNGELNIRPPFQREFVYKEKQRDEVLRTVKSGFPLNSIYWTTSDNGGYELLDGQQRILSILQYLNGDYSIDYQFADNLTKEERDKILDYKLTIYFCTGTDKEKLDWFKVINTQGETLTDQELRNAIYSGEWVTDAKRYFSKTGCAAYQIGGDYMKGTAIRQDYLEAIIKWIADRDGIDTIEEYMAIHQHDTTAAPLYNYFQDIISWIKTYFKYRKEMKGLPWGIFYNLYKDKQLDPKEIEERTVELMMDDDVTSKKGIYQYLLSGEEKHLNIRKFSPAQKRAVYERQGGICNICKKELPLKEAEADHITPWVEGGKTDIENCQILCKSCNRAKGKR